ncbi:hypothetical protein HB777_01435 [Mesorhizobium loti]|nr:hypothetical protein HB777_01435 [Mesorhizobium loti]
MADDPAGKLAVMIVDALSKLTGDQTSFMSYRSIGNLVHCKVEDPGLLHSIAILSSPKINVLKSMFVYKASDGEEVVLSSAQWRDAKRAGFLVDPHSGEKIDDFQELTYPYFRTSGEFQELVRRAHG